MKQDKINATEMASQLVNDFSLQLPSIINCHLEIGESDTETAKKCAILFCSKIKLMLKELRDEDSSKKFSSQIQFFDNVIGCIKKM